ncbi:hypothetical protein K443DRAFT_573955 [Laccaria amethystina LaAM-08-1]|uniref:Uncharacterized protein n=1 Tax=Laccaria amethystina LaAM-08-1 TaxID=1095629 RepID=A0A0C9X858_9AGAR|nr:hypothetical protein K443DRAFT_573955 [Laccaria amethystina LaAM-08-1]
MNSTLEKGFVFGRPLGLGFNDMAITSTHGHITKTELFNTRTPKWYSRARTNLHSHILEETRTFFHPEILGRVLAQTCPHLCHTGLEMYTSSFFYKAIYDGDIFTKPGAHSPRARL